MRFLGHSLKNAKVALIGVPYESKQVFIRGASQAPFKVRWASESIESYSIYQKEEVLNYTDMGDIPVFEVEEKKAFEMVRTYAQNLHKGLKPLFLGGDHSITYPIVVGLLNKHPELIVLHIDAHMDRRKFFGSEWNYATTIRKIEKTVGKKRVFSFGVRSMAQDEEISENIFFFKVFDPLKKIMKNLRDFPLYLSIDLDVLSPGIFPAVTNPEPNGIFFDELLNTISLLKGQLIGMDVVEYNPTQDQGFAWATTVAVLVRESLLVLFDKKG